MKALPKEFQVSVAGLPWITVVPDEFHPYEPSAYVTDPGWTCYTDPGSDDAVEYFVSIDGTVYEQPSNEVVGVVQELADAADRLERQISDPRPYTRPNDA